LISPLRAAVGGTPLPRSARLRALWQKATKLRLSVLGSAGPPTSTTARPGREAFPGRAPPGPEIEG